MENFGTLATAQAMNLLSKGSWRFIKNFDDGYRQDIESGPRIHHWTCGFCRYRTWIRWKLLINEIDPPYVFDGKIDLMVEDDAEVPE